MDLRSGAHAGHPGLCRRPHWSRFFQWDGGFFVKYPGEGNFVPWHQDSQYWPLSPRKTITASLAFYDGTRDNGAMQVLRGSHRLGQIPHHDVTGEEYILGQEIDAD
ncbi:MAG: hypothetical protein CME28_02360 [Gemmatimonadetes bacterium]|nr:hypothetical protein [Gemmatimonadota bacterium]